MALGRKLAGPPTDLAAWDAWLGTLEWDATQALGRAKAMPDNDADRADGLVPWLKAFEATLREHRADLAALEAGEVGSPASLAELAPRSGAAAELMDRVRRISERAAVFIKEMDFTFLYKEDRHLFSIGMNLAQDRLDASCYDLLASESMLTSYLTVARGDVPRRHWFQLGRPYIKVAGRLGLLSWGGTMFEYLMPRLLLKALHPRHADRPDDPRHRRPAGRVWQAERRALGDLRVRLLGAVSRRRLPVPVVRRAGPRPEARAGQRPGGRPLRDGPRRDDRAPRGPCQLPAARGRGGPRALRILRGDRLHARARPARAEVGRRQVVHGAPPGDEPDRAGQRDAGRPDAEAVLHVVGGPVVGAAPPGADPARRAPDRDARRRGHARPDPLVGDGRRRLGAADDPPDRHGLHPRAPDPSALQRRIRRDGHQRRVGLQHLPLPRRDPLARGLHPRRVGPVLLHPRPGLGRRLVGRPPADPPRGRRLRGRLLLRQGELPPPRRGDRDQDGGRRLPRGIGRVPPGHAHELRQHTPRAPRRDELRRGRARPARGPALRTRRSTSSSSRPSGSSSPGRCSAGGGRGRTTRSRSGRCTSRPSTPSRARPSTRPTAPGSSAGAGRPPRPPRSTRARPCPGPSAPCSTRS